MKRLIATKQHNTKNGCMIGVCAMIGVCMFIYLNLLRSINEIADYESWLTSDLFHVHQVPANETVNKTMLCKPPLMYYKDRLIDHTSTIELQNSLIPRTLHVSFKSRCLPQDIYMYMKRWEEKLPYYDIRFHDDNAVQSLVQDNEYWSKDFPWLKAALACILSKGAMTIDVWRVMVLYKYGGVYTDIDNWPEDTFQEQSIPTNVSGFFYSDSWNRPSQWFMALEPNHPVTFLALENIISNLLEMQTLTRPKLVFITGPHAVRQAYIAFACNQNISLDYYRAEKLNGRQVMLSDCHDSSVDVLESHREYYGMSGKTVRKEPYPHGIVTSKKYYDDSVEHNGNVTLRRTRIAEESGIMHWTKSSYGNQTSHKQCRLEQENWRASKEAGGMNP